MENRGEVRLSSLFQLMISTFKAATAVADLFFLTILVLCALRLTLLCSPRHPPAMTVLINSDDHLERPCCKLFGKGGLDKWLDEVSLITGKLQPIRSRGGSATAGGASWGIKILPKQVGSRIQISYFTELSVLFPTLPSIKCNIQFRCNWCYSIVCHPPSLSNCHCVSGHRRITWRWIWKIARSGKSKSLAR